MPERYWVPDVVALAHALGGVVALPEQPQQLLVGDLLGANTTSTTSLWPGAPGADLLVGGVGREARRRSPTAVVYTPGASQKMRSAPQKQPMPKTARSVSSGKGGSSGVPSTKWRSGTANGRVSRPGSASSGSGMSVLWRVRKLMVFIESSAPALRFTVPALTELELPEFDFIDTDADGRALPRDDDASCARRAGSPAAELGYFVLDRESAAFFLRTKSATFPGMKIAELFGVEEGPLYEEMRRNILHVNGDDHRRLRNLVNPAFTPRAADRWRPAMRELPRAALGRRGRRRPLRVRGATSPSRTRRSRSRP